MTVPVLDHVVYMVKPGQLELAMSIFGQLGFTVKRGGKHTDGLTGNALITFEDGTYLELIAFQEHPTASTGEKQAAFEQRRKTHPWWDKTTSWVDWALAGGTSDGRAASVTEHAKAAGVILRYSEPIPGGRTTSEGKKLEWRLCVPEASTPRSAVPFWCEDVSPREWRVPSSDPPHRNRSDGISGLTVLYPPGDSAKAMTLDHLALALDERPSKHVRQTQPSVPLTALDLKVRTPAGSLIYVHVRVADGSDELKWVEENGPGLYEVELSVAADQLPPTAPPDGLEQTTAAQQWGRIRLHPLFHDS